MEGNSQKFLEQAYLCCLDLDSNGSKIPVKISQSLESLYDKAKIEQNQGKFIHANTDADLI